MILKLKYLFLFGLSSLHGNLLSQVIDLDHELVARYLFEGDARNIVEDANHGIDKHRRVLTKWREISSEPYPFSFTSLEAGLAGGILDQAIYTYTCTYHFPWDGELIETKSDQFAQTTLNTADIYIGRTFTPLVEKFFLEYFDDLYFYDRAIEACEGEALFSGQLLDER